MSPELSSTNNKKYLLPRSVSGETDPQISPWTSSKGLLALYEAIQGYGLLCCLFAMHPRQIFSGISNLGSPLTIPLEDNLLND